MYKAFFGLKEIPFSIAPNPEYLYMSERHKEALAHLLFGLNETGGFVLLTGEVGTGKTTVSRCLLAQIPDNTQIAFILNPTLTEWELLATVCDEFKIGYDADKASIKTLTDAIKLFLQQQHELNNKCLLIIDEAQHLRAEVLEQLRLLTNLETNTKKLLQVILIGQPELQALLKRQELRQLAQRITARYHLLPLTESQIAYYINHRMKVAGCDSAVFTKAAVAAIYQVSKGIPRVINLLCDRALMGAYAANKLKVDKPIVLSAAKEVVDFEQVKTATGLTWLKRDYAYIAAIVVLVTAFFTFQQLSNDGVAAQPNEQSTSQMIEQVKPTAVDKLASLQGTLPEQFSYLANLWQLPTDALVTGKNQGAAQISNACQSFAKFELACQNWQGSFAQLLSLNIPAVIELYLPNQSIRYAVLSAANKNAGDWQASQLTLTIDNQSIELSFAELKNMWRGQALYIWQPPFIDQVDVISADSELKQIQWLDSQLNALLNKPRRLTESFDEVLVNNLKAMQINSGLAIKSKADISLQTLIQQNTLNRVARIY
ncbi:ExeA family protein [Catenovulum agarivorans]|uniref:ExeA family protein n=1 Tax=Catenovulum agarivorans TaxID=1172192 RepID=UPI0002F87C0C|nr:AAA family ATPase [Catenovulum agarivorans]